MSTARNREGTCIEREYAELCRVIAALDIFDIVIGMMYKSAEWLLVILCYACVNMCSSHMEAVSGGCE